MYSMNMPESSRPFTAIDSFIPAIKAGKPRPGKLWSNLNAVCDLLRMQISLSPFASNEEVLFQHVQFKAGQRIYSMGKPFEMLYIVNSGFLKTVVVDEFGTEQVLSFPMKSDLLCMDGIHTNHHVSEAIALSDCDLIMLPFKKLVSLGRHHAELEYAMYQIMSRELMREQTMSVLLGSLNAETRVTRFLVSLSDKFYQLGYSSKTFNLRMTRQEIGSYLGLTLETVSRTLSALSNIGLILVDQKSIELIDVNALRTFRKFSAENVRIKQDAAAKLKSISRKVFQSPKKFEQEGVVAA